MYSSWWMMKVDGYIIYKADGLSRYCDRQLILHIGDFVHDPSASFSSKRLFSKALVVAFTILAVLDHNSLKSAPSIFPKRNIDSLLQNFSGFIGVSVSIVSMCFDPQRDVSDGDDQKKS